MTSRQIRKVTNPMAQRLRAYRYWQSRTVPERMQAIDDVVWEAYFAKGIDLDRRPSSRSLVRIVRADWKAA